MGEREHTVLRDDLIRSLEGIYQLKAFGALAELLQGESLVLQYLSANREGEVFPSTLSEACRLSRSRITGALNSLRRKGHVRMEHSSHDRRMVRVSITEEGLTRIGGQMGQMAEYFDRMIAGVGAEDTRRLVELIDRCVAVMED